MVILVKPSILVAAFLSFATDDVEAFFPSSSFVCKRCSKQVSSVVSGKCVHPLSGLRYSARRSCLSMNLFDRFQRVAKSNLNNLLKIMEDPEKIMNQAVEDMQNDLVKVRQSYAEITATQRRLLKQKDQADSMANDWYGRAQLALQKGNEELAREALSRRQQQVDKAGGLKNQVETQAAAIDKLYESMQELESRILEARAKKDQMIARARTAKSTQEVNDMLTGLTGRSSMDAFTKMEEKVESLEAAAEISSDMAMRGDMALPGSSSLDKEFKLLESSSSVDDELKKMKGLLKASADPKTPRAPSPTSGIVDDEMEKLRQDAGL